MCRNEQFDNIRELRDDMRRREIIITSFMYTFNEVECVVLINDLKKQGRETKNNFALLQLIFIKTENSNQRISLEVNKYGVLGSGIDVKEFREFFQIKYTVTLGNIINQIKRDIAQNIPRAVVDNLNHVENDNIIRYLCEADSENPNRLFIIGVKRNGVNKDNKRKKRSVFNNEKTRRLYPNLYEEFENDEFISFCYSEDQSKEKSMIEIMRNFTRNDTKF